MAQQTINVGTAPNDGTGTPLRTAFQYTNSNFSELYTAVGPSGNNIVVPGNATITGDLTVATSGLKVDSLTGRIAINTATFATGAIGVIQSSATRWAGFNLNNSAGTLGGTIGLDASGSGGGSQDLTVLAVGTNLSLYSGNNLQFKIAHPGIFTWYDGAGGTRMTLNATGLGVGVVPSSGKLEVGIGAGTTTPLFRFYGNSGSWNGQFNFDASGNLQAYSYNGTKFTDFIWPYGNVGIGVTPSAWGAGYKALQLGNGLSLMGSPLNGTIAGNAWFDGTNWKYVTAYPATLYYASYGANGSHVWSISSGVPSAGGNVSFTNAMTLDASGNLLVGTTNSVVWNTTNQGCVVSPNSIQASRSGDTVLLLNRIGSNGKIAVFARQGLEVGDISVTTTGTTFNSTSDYRLKEAVQPLVGGLARVSALKPSIYKWKSNGSSGEGFLAHELAEVVPAAVSGEKDAVNEDGSIKAQSIDMSRVVPILVAAIQELAAEVNALKNA